VIAEPLRARQLPTTEALLEWLADKNPDLEVNRQRIAQGRAAVELAERERKPDFGVQYMWQHTASEFRDYYMATFSIKLPNRSRVRAMEGEAHAKLAQAESEKQARLKQMESGLGEQIAMAQASEQQLKVYDDGLIPQSQAALAAALAGYSAGKQEYQGLLASFSETLQLAIEREQMLTQHESAIARIEALIGRELP
jgi:outer membrane protein TolC